MLFSDFKKYFFVLFITSIVFFGAFFLSNQFNLRRINEVKNLGESITVNILSLETQFALLGEASCKDIDDPVLSGMLNELAVKVSYLEGKRGFDDNEVLNLKKHYSLLQIRHYLLMKKLITRCKPDPLPIFVIYFYSNKGDCPDCVRQGYVLTYLRENYPVLKVYAFDYNINLSAVETLISILKISGELPILVINDKVFSGFKSIEDLTQILSDFKGFVPVETQETEPTVTLKPTYIIESVSL